MQVPLACDYKIKKYMQVPVVCDYKIKKFR